MSGGTGAPHLKRQGQMALPDHSGSYSAGREAAPQDCSHRGWWPFPGPQHHSREKQQGKRPIFLLLPSHLIPVPAIDQAQAAARGTKQSPKGAPPPPPGAQRRAERVLLVVEWVGGKQRIISYSGSLAISQLLHTPAHLLHSAGLGGGGGVPDTAIRRWAFSRCCYQEHTGRWQEVTAPLWDLLPSSVNPRG